MPGQSFCAPQGHQERSSELELSAHVLEEVGRGRRHSSKRQGATGDDDPRSLEMCSGGESVYETF